MSGGSSTGKVKVPKIIVNKHKPSKLNRIKDNLNDFCYAGEIVGNVDFRIDTGSDVSILNVNLIELDKIKINNCNLRYPTTEKILI